MFQKRKKAKVVLKIVILKLKKTPYLLPLRVLYYYRICSAI